MTSTRTKSPTTTKTISAQQFLKLAKTAPKQAHQLTVSGFTMAVSAQQSLGGLLDVVNDDGTVDTQAAFGLDDIVMALAAAILLELIMDGSDNDRGVTVSGGANDEATVQSSDGGDSPDGGGDTGGGGDDGGDGEGADPDGGGNTNGGNPGGSGG